MRKFFVAAILLSMCFFAYGCASDTGTMSDEVSADEMSRVKTLQAVTAAEEAHEAIDDEQADDMTHN